MLLKTAVKGRVKGLIKDFTVHAGICSLTPERWYRYPPDRAAESPKTFFLLEGKLTSRAFFSPFVSLHLNYNTITITATETRGRHKELPYDVISIEQW